MNFSPLFLLAASRTPASSLGTRVRLCVRCVFRLLAFSLVRPLPSTSSAVAAVATLFGGLVGTMGLCDFPSSFVGGLQPGPSRRVPTAPSASGDVGISRFSRLETPYMLGVFDRAGSSLRSRFRAGTCGLPLAGTASAPGIWCFRGSIARPVCTPVNASTAPLRIQPHDSGPSWIASKMTAQREQDATQTAAATRAERSERQTCRYFVRRLHGRNCDGSRFGSGPDAACPSGEPWPAAGRITLRELRERSAAEATMM